MRVDLHIHSHLSDGKYSPSEVVRYSVKNKLDIIAITDHDTIDGFQEAQKAVRTSDPITIIPGVEFSTWLESDELHILGYGIDETHPGLLELLASAQTKRHNRIRRIVRQLGETGIYITIDDIKNGYCALSLGRMHVASTLVKQGYVRTIRDAFDRYLSYDAHVINRSGTDFIPALVAVECILEAGGIPVFAHPTIELFDRHIETLIQYGIRGVEVFKGSRSSIEEFYLETSVEHKGLLITGGSDWHGHHPSRNLGSFYVDSERIQPFLKAMHLEAIKTAVRH